VVRVRRLPTTYEAGFLDNGPDTNPTWFGQRKRIFAGNSDESEQCEAIHSPDECGTSEPRRPSSSGGGRLPLPRADYKCHAYLALGQFRLLRRLLREICTTASTVLAFNARIRLMICPASKNNTSIHQAS
jgi:hypothetical protein